MSDPMTPEGIFDSMEAGAKMAYFLHSIKQGLLDRGWTDEGAAEAAREALKQATLNLELELEKIRAARWGQQI